MAYSVVHACCLTLIYSSCVCWLRVRTLLWSAIAHILSRTQSAAADCRRYILISTPTGFASVNLDCHARPATGHLRGKSSAGFSPRWVSEVMLMVFCTVFGAGIYQESIKNIPWHMLHARACARSQGDTKAVTAYLRGRVSGRPPSKSPALWSQWQDRKDRSRSFCSSSIIGARQSCIRIRAQATLRPLALA